MNKRNGKPLFNDPITKIKKEKTSPRVQPSYQPRNKSQVIIINKLNVDSANEVYKVKKAPPHNFFYKPENLISKQYKNIWYMKDTDPSYGNPLYEVIAQEFFRLFITGQPKTRFILGFDEYRRTRESTISKEVPGFISLNDLINGVNGNQKINVKQKIKEGQYYGLGEVLVLSLLMNEYDLNSQNIGVNNLGQIIKIDGGYCFKELDEGKKEGEFYKKMPITTQDLQLLPFIQDYPAYNWLDIIKHLNREISNTVDSKLSDNPLFREEVNKALLRVVVTPPSLLKKFTFDCVPACLREEKDAKYHNQTNHCSEEVCDRQSQMIDAALNLDSFKEYLLNDAAHKEYGTWSAHLKEFKTLGKRGLDFHLYEDEMLERFNSIQNSVVYGQTDRCEI